MTIRCQKGTFESLTDGQRVRPISLINKGLTDLRTLWLAGSISESQTLPEWDADDRPKLRKESGKTQPNI